MRFGVERHRSCAALSLQSLEERQFVRCFFSRDCRRSVPTGGECELSCVIKRTAIDTGANGNRVDDLSAFGIEHHHHFVVATGEQTMMCSIQRDSTWFFSGCNRPVRDDFMFVDIDHRDFAFIFDVAVNAPRVFIYCRELRCSSERNRRCNGSDFRIDNGDRISSVIENIDLTMTRLVNNSVRIWAFWKSFSRLLDPQHSISILCHSTRNHVVLLVRPRIRGRQAYRQFRRRRHFYANRQRRPSSRAKGRDGLQPNLSSRYPSRLRPQSVSLLQSDTVRWPSASHSPPLCRLGSLSWRPKRFPPMPLR